MSSKSNLKEILSKLDTLPKSFLINLGIPQKSLDKKEQLSTISNANNQLYPFNINFKQRNYVSSFRDNSTNKYDTIMCLSTVKWVHLNYGDIGVKLLFYNIYSELKDGGIFIFEPQNWKSYKKRRNLNERIKTNFSNISFRPEQFKTFLEEVYNFKCINKLQPPSNSKKSFDRPIFIFRKELPK